MAHVRWIAPLRRGFVIATLAALAATPAHALKVATWNVLDYPNSDPGGRHAAFATSFAALDPDLLIVQEQKSQAGQDSLLAILRAALPARHWGVGGYLPTTESSMFFDSLKVVVTNFTSLSYGSTTGRTALFGVVKPVGYRTNAAWFRLFSVHLKAGNGSVTPQDSTDRRTEATNLRTAINNQFIGAVGPNFLLGGDFNLYGAWEGAYVRLTESQPDNDGRCVDPLNLTGTWHTVSDYASYDTQAPCASGCPSYFSGGGMDDRFDILFSSTSMQDGLGADLELPSGYYAFGNDGFHFNASLNDYGFNNAVGFTVATALRNASDHIPVVATVRLPAKVSTASALAFPTAVVGSPAAAALLVADGGTVPADSLRYSLAAPAGFTAPGGPFAVAAGAPAQSQTLGMDTSTRGLKTGTLVVSSNDPDSLTKNVLLSGTVLSQSSSSLDSLAVVTDDTLDLGTHYANDFVDGMVRVHDVGWDALQAQVAVDGATITGGDGRFSLVGGFTPTTVAGVAKTWNVHFDAGGATPESLYTATLAFATSDQPLGRAGYRTLTVALRALPLSGSTGVPRPPLALRFEPPRPNPSGGAAHVAFELPAAAAARLEVFDLSGRRVARLADGAFGPGRHEFTWDGRDDEGRGCRAGLYFVRFTTPGLSRTARLARLP